MGFKLLFVILAVLVGVFCEENLQLSKTSLAKLKKINAVHADIIKDYQPRINSVAQNIIDESKILTEKISLATTLVKQEISDSVSTMSADIRIVQNLIVQYLKISSIKASPSATSCLKILQIRATSLNTNNIQICYDSDEIKSLTVARDNVLTLKSLVVSLPQTCRIQHPVESDIIGMTQCLQMNLDYAETQVDNLVLEAEGNIKAFQEDADGCVLNGEQDISDVTNDIPNEAEQCKALAS